ncbi:MAG TPA: hypothetical protein VNS88_15530, partial [Nitrospiraceae bacterium]|nr:hypothetical protein [Nitrospiraceae bacterium]
DENNGHYGCGDPPMVAARAGDRYNWGRGRLYVDSGVSILRTGTNGCQESIPPSRHGLYERRILRRVTQRVAQTPDSGVEAMVEIDIGVGRPKVVAQFLPRDDLARAFKQLGEYLKRLLLQLDLDAIAAKLSGAQVELKHAKTAGRRQVVAVCTPHKRQV